MKPGRLQCAFSLTGKLRTGIVLEDENGDEEG